MSESKGLLLGERVVHRGVLGEETRLSLLADAIAQDFSPIDPTGIDNPTRPGERISMECYGFEDQLAWLWDQISDRVCEATGFVPTKINSRLKRLTEGGFYKRHIDGAYPGAELPICSFIYYLADRSTYEGGNLVFDDGFVEPEDDLLVIFRSDDAHGVSLVTSTPGYEALRLTLAGDLA